MSNGSISKTVGNEMNQHKNHHIRTFQIELLKELHPHSCTDGSRLSVNSSPEHFAFKLHYFFKCIFVCIFTYFYISEVLTLNTNEK